MSLYATARHIYIALKDDATAMEAVRSERARLALEIATDPQAGLQITSSTVNGQSFTASASGMMTGNQKLSMLSQVCAMDNAGRVPSRDVIPTF